MHIGLIVYSFDSSVVTLRGLTHIGVYAAVHNALLKLIMLNHVFT